jgi:transcriptional regulator with XRE-family HTH domain
MTDTPPPTADETLIAHRIREWRRNTYDWTLQHFAEQLADAGISLSASQLGKIETGKRALSLPELIAICRVFAVDLNHLTRPGRLCASCGQEIPEATK